MPDPAIETESLYLVSKVGGMLVDCLIDSGSSLSVIHPFRLSSFGTHVQISPVEDILRMADGGLVQQFGKDPYHVETIGW